MKKAAKLMQAGTLADGRTGVHTLGVYGLFLWSFSGIFQHKPVKISI